MDLLVVIISVQLMLISLIHQFISCRLHCFPFPRSVVSVFIGISWLYHLLIIID